jgi:menaquinone-dependent protoporphyrinogen oxidase
MTVLVTAASRHQATAEIATALAEAIAHAGLETELRSPAEVTNLDAYDAVVLGSAVYVGRWLPEATRFVERHRDALSTRPLWLFSSGPVGSPEAKPEEGPAGLTELASELRAREHRILTGRIDRRRLRLCERAILRVGGAPEGDFRDWDAVEGWGREIAEVVSVAPAGVG